jgi:hypothetical protein
MGFFGKKSAYNYVLENHENVVIWAVAIKGIYYKGVVMTPKGCFKFDTGGARGVAYPNITKKWALTMIAGWRVKKKVTPRELFKNWERFGLYEGRTAEINWARHWGYYENK